MPSTYATAILAAWLTACSSASPAPPDVALDTSADVDVSENVLPDALLPVDAGDDAAPTCADTVFPPSPPLADVIYSSWNVYPCVSLSGTVTSTCVGTCRDAAAAYARCEAVQIGEWQGLGSTAYRVYGVEGGDCIIDVGRETEGDVAWYRCRRPLSQSLCCWGSLPISTCDFLGTCGVIVGSPDPTCMPGPSSPPVCTDASTCS